MTITTNSVSGEDAELVARTLAGDRDAMAEIYQRYADRIHTMCVHMLNDRDDASEVCGDVFLTAFERLGQLKDPSKLRPWMFAICRHEVFRRTKTRNRTKLIEEVTEMERLSHRPGGDLGSEGSGSEQGGPAEDAQRQQSAALMIQQAANGLDDVDRVVLELDLAGLDGEELAAALGVTTSTGYQRVHRMRERLERSIGAFVVGQKGRADCSVLDRLLADWDGRLTVVWRKRIARHVDDCATCDVHRRGIPAIVAGTAGAAPLVAAPTSVRTRVLDLAEVGGAGSGAEHATRSAAWTADGFPPATIEASSARRTSWIAAMPAVLAILVAIVAALLIWSLRSGDRDLTVSSSGSPTVSVTVTSALPPDTAQVSTTLAVAPSTMPPTSPSSTKPSPTTSTTTTAPASPPSLKLEGPAVVRYATPGAATCELSEPFTAVVESDAPVVSVTLEWSSARSRVVNQVPMALSEPGRWVAMIEPDTRSVSPITIVAIAQTESGITATGNTVSSRIASCVVVG